MDNPNRFQEKQLLPLPSSQYDKHSENQVYPNRYLCLSTIKSMNPNDVDLSLKLAYPEGTSFNLVNLADSPNINIETSSPIYFPLKFKDHCEHSKKDAPVMKLLEDNPLNPFGMEPLQTHDPLLGRNLMESNFAKTPPSFMNDLEKTSECGDKGSKNTPMVKNDFKKTSNSGNEDSNNNATKRKDEESKVLRVTSISDRVTVNNILRSRPELAQKVSSSSPRYLNTPSPNNVARNANLGIRNSGKSISKK